MPKHWKVSQLYSCGRCNRDHLCALANRGLDNQHQCVSISTENVLTEFGNSALGNTAPAWISCLGTRPSHQNINN